MLLGTVQVHITGIELFDSIYWCVTGSFIDFLSKVVLAAP